MTVPVEAKFLPHRLFQGEGVTINSGPQLLPPILQDSLMAMGSNETVVPAFELQEAMRRIKQLEGALGRKTLENEILKEAVDFAKAKK
jgi:transposase